MINQQKLNEYFTFQCAKYFKTNDKKELAKSIKINKIKTRILNDKTGQYFSIFKGIKLIAQINLLYFIISDKNDDNTSTDNV